MKKITLTPTERLLLANQFTILSQLLPDSKQYYENMVQIAERGYEILYSELFTNISEGLSVRDAEEVYDIFDMYRKINNYISTLSIEDQKNPDFEKIKFEGFDKNNGPHYSFARFLINDFDTYSEYKGTYLNSHLSISIDKYRRMLSVYRKIPATTIAFSKADIDNLIASV